MARFLERPCGARIHYQVKGTGIPVLLIAPGGMRSCVANWAAQPYDPWTHLPLDEFQLVAMDQRSAQIQGGRSSAQITPQDGWETFMDDQIALLDHLQIPVCHTIGSCIGPSFQLRLLREHPDRFGRAVLMQPIGQSHATTEPQPWGGLNTEAPSHWFGDWALAMEHTGLADKNILSAVYENMFGKRDFVFSVTREDVQEMSHEMLVLMGLDVFHPSETAREIARLGRNARLIEKWRNCGLEHLDEAVEQIKQFLEASLEESGLESEDSITEAQRQADAEAEAALEAMGF